MPKVRRTQRRWGSGFLLVPAFIFLLLGCSALVRSWEIVTTYSQTQGTEKVRCVSDPDGDSEAQDACTYHIDILYQVHGEKYDDNFNSLPMVFSNPAPVTVLYNPQDPEEEVVSSFANLWFEPYILLFICVFFLALSVARV